LAQDVSDHGLNVKLNRPGVVVEEEEERKGRVLIKRKEVHVACISYPGGTCNVT
jgi:hypothetical protein